MQKINKMILTATLLITCITPLRSQEFVNENETYESNVEESSAYYGGSRAAHWSAYVPIGVLIAAAIWLGFADNTHTQDSSCKSSSNYCH